MQVRVANTKIINCHFVTGLVESQNNRRHFFDIKKCMLSHFKFNLLRTHRVLLCFLIDSRYQP